MVVVVGRFWRGGSAEGERRGRDVALGGWIEMKKDDWIFGARRDGD